MAKEDFKEFISNLKAVGLPTASRFFVLLPNADTMLCMLVDQCSLPGISIMTTEMRTFGEVREAAYGVTYPPVQLSVILDNTVGATTYFENWSRLVFDRKTKTSGYYTTTRGIMGYAKDVSIVLTDKEDYPIRKIELIEAYPKTIGDIQLDYSNKDIIRLPITLTYRYWREARLTEEDMEFVSTRQGM